MPQIRSSSNFIQNDRILLVSYLEKYLCYVFFKYIFSFGLLLMKQVFSLIVVFAMFGVLFGILPSAYSQISGDNTDEQTILSGDLLNNPLAMEIIQKIEESKRKIANLEQQNYDNVQAQRFLEDRRAVALDRLNQSLILWEEEWHEFSPKMAYQKFIDKMPSDVKGIYAKQFEFTETKHELGVTAKTNALDDGMTSSKALQKFNSAARSTVAELNYYNESIQPDTPSEIRTKIAIIQGYVDSDNASYFYHHERLKGELNAKYAIEVGNERSELREVLRDYHANIISGDELTEQLGMLREKYTPIKENLLEENAKTLSESEKKYMDSIQRTIDGINANEDVSPFIEAVWDSKLRSIELVRK